MGSGRRSLKNWGSISHSVGRWPSDCEGKTNVIYTVQYVGEAPLFACFLTPICPPPNNKSNRSLQKLPEDCTLEDIQYHLYVLDKVQQGLDDAQQKGTVTQEEAEKHLSRWLTE